MCLYCTKLELKGFEENTEWAAQSAAHSVFVCFAGEFGNTGKQNGRAEGTPIPWFRRNRLVLFWCSVVKNVRTELVKSGTQPYDLIL